MPVKNLNLISLPKRHNQPKWHRHLNKLFKQIIMRKILTLMLAVGITALASAQVITAKNISLDAAKKVVAAAVEYAKANNAPGGAIAVVDAGGNLVYLERLDGTFAASAEI